jgi:hypothetical protein
MQDEMKRIDEDLTEAEAKNRLYYLLGERTRYASTLWDRQERARVAANTLNMPPNTPMFARAPKEGETG